ncbi:Protein 60A [Eufriesea mexicana]|uniref:Protein 60A n=1 Tax=Eufriesea mexicana TaxID=516756 RepID=A0A310S8F1_9HYME|nr:Protein 60A [Eufriesea mexicana]
MIQKEDPAAAALLPTNNPTGRKLSNGSWNGCTREDCRRRTEDVEKEEAGGVKNKSPVGRGAVQDGPKLFGTTPRAEGSSSARGNQVPLECDHHHVPGVRHERGKRLWFDVSEVPPGEHIIGAELRLYRSMDVKNRRNRGSYMITAYRVLRTEDGTRELQYVDAVNTTTGKEGWLTLNVSEPLDHWVNNPDGNKGLYLSVHPADRSVFVRHSRSFLPSQHEYIIDKRPSRGVVLSSYTGEMCVRGIQPEEQTEPDCKTVKERRRETDMNGVETQMMR